MPAETTYFVKLSVSLIEPSCESTRYVPSLQYLLSLTSPLGQAARLERLQAATRN